MKAQQRQDELAATTLPELNELRSRCNRYREEILSSEPSEGRYRFLAEEISRIETEIESLTTKLHKSYLRTAKQAIKRFRSGG